MKHKLRKIMLLAVLGIVFGCAESNHAQIKTGGYKKVPVADVGVVAAAEYAVDTQGEKDELEITLDAVVKAERQTVAGTNYKLCLQILVETPDEELTEQFVEAVIFKSLKNIYALKSWTERENCGE